MLTEEDIKKMAEEFAKSDKAIVGDVIPRENIPVALITLEDHIREEAYDTIKWFKDNGVQVKVISGDNPATVAEIANKISDAYKEIK